LAGSGTAPRGDPSGRTLPRRLQQAVRTHTRVVRPSHGARWPTGLKELTPRGGYKAHRRSP
jgi:hypothetical protein